MLHRILLQFCLVFFGLFFIQAFAGFRGRVVDAKQKPVPGVIVSIKGTGIIDTTNESGVFTQGATGLKCSPSMQSPIIWENAKIRLILSHSTNLSLKFYGLQGELLSTLSQTRLDAGRHNIPIFPHQSKFTGLVLVQAVLDDNVYYHRFFFHRHIKTRITASGPFRSLAKTTADTTRLLFKKRGYLLGILPTVKKEGDLGDIRLGRISNNMRLIEAKDSSYYRGKDKESFEKPRHKVTFTRNFWMDTTEVTQADFEALMGEGPYSLSSYSKPVYKNPLKPVIMANWNTVIAYCNARSRRDGFDSVYTYTGFAKQDDGNLKIEGLRIHLNRNGYRLPTDAEWEYAARAGTTTDYYWGKNYVQGGSNKYPSSSADTAEISSYVVWRIMSFDLGVNHPNYGPHPVASKKPNAFGLYDILGNTKEWCHDFYGPFPAGPQTDPSGPNSTSSEYRVIRNSGWIMSPNGLQVTKRSSLMPISWDKELGFRVVLPVPNP